MEERGSTVRGTLLHRAPLGAQMVKNLPAMQETRVQSLGWEDPLVGTHGYPLQHSCLDNSMDRGAGGLQSMESQRLGYN